VISLASLSAFATLPAIALFVVVHGTVFAALFAIRFVRCKGCCANHSRQNRKQDFRVISHAPIFDRDRRSCQQKVVGSSNEVTV